MRTEEGRREIEKKRLRDRSQMSNLERPLSEKLESSQCIVKNYKCKISGKLDLLIVF